MKHFSKTFSALFLITFLFSEQIFSQTRVVVNGNYIVMSGGTGATPNYMVVDNNSVNGITRVAGHIISGGQYNSVKWNCGSATGNFVFPFGFSTTDYLPLSFNKITAGSAALSVSTWNTAANNLPWAGVSNVAAVSNMDCNAIGGDGSTPVVIDRWWSIAPSAVVAGDVTFSYRGAENTTDATFGGPTGNFGAQVWNGTSWQAPVGSSAGVVGGVGTVSATGMNTFAPFVLSKVLAPLSPLCTPPVISVSSNVTICNGSSTTLTATITSATTPNYDYAWTPNNGSITPANTNTAALTNTTTASPSVTTTYTCLVTDGVGCTSLPAMVTVTVKNAPTTANAGPDQTLCFSSTATLAGNTPAVGSGVWSMVSGTATITTPTSPTSGVTGLLVGGSATLRWTISNAPCASATDDVVITVKAFPTLSNAGADQTLCNITTATLNGNPPVSGTGAWSVIAGSAVVTSPTLPNSGVTGLTVGAASTMRWTISNAPCAASTDDVIINVSAQPTASAGGSQTICQNGTAVVSGASSANGTILWTENGAGSITSGATTLTPTYSAAAGDAGSTVTLTMTVSNAPCAAATATYSVTVNAQPTALSGGSTSICENGSYSLAAGEASYSNGTILWTENGAGSITAGATTPAPTYTAASGDAGNTVTLTMTVSNAPCANATATYSIAVKGIPTAANAGSDQTLCSSTATLAGNTAVVGTGSWSVIYGTAGVTTPSSPTSGVTGLTSGTDTLSWTIANAPCPASTDKVVLNISTPPTTSAAGPDQNLCNVTTATLAGNTAITGGGLWTVLSGTATITTPSSPTSGVTGLVIGSSATLRWTISNTPCAASTDDVVITSSPLPAANAGADITMCVGGNTTLNGSGNGTYSWSPSAGLSCTTCANPVANPSVSVNYSLSVTNSCGTASDAVSVNLAPMVTIDSIHSVSACDAKGDGGIFISAVNGTPTYTYLWNPGSVTTQDITGITPGSYTVTVTDGSGCVSKAWQNLYVAPPPTTLEVCISTVDSVASAFVEIFWEKPITALIDSFRVYRENATVFTPIATISYNKLSMFKDTTPGVDPKNQSHKYKISSIDNSHVEGPLSNIHETMWLKVTQPSPPAFNLTWTDYCGFPVSIYYIYRDSLHNGDYELIDSAYWGTNAYTDLTPPNDTARYRIELLVPTPCTSTGKYPDPAATTVKGSKSNSDNKLGLTSLEDVIKGNWVTVYPNPSSGAFWVSSLKSQMVNIKIYNMLGALIYQKPVNAKQAEIKLPALPYGVYQLEVITVNGSVNRKIMVE